MRAIRHLAQFAAYGAAVRAIRALPHRRAAAAGAAAGALAWRLSAKGRRQTLWNLRHALPELENGERLTLARRCFRRLGANVFDALSADRFSADELLALVDVDGREHLDQALAEQRGALLLSAHLGAFEVAAWALGHLAGPLHVVSDELSNRRLDRELRRRRERHGLASVPQTGAGRRMYALLAGGARLMIALDQRTRYEDAIAAEFFGRVSLTSPVPAYLAQLLTLPTVPVFAIRRDGRYRVEIGTAVHPTGTGREGVARLTQRYLDLIEARIRRDPAEWMWHYRRWRPEWDDPTKVGSSLAIRSDAAASPR